MMISSSAIERYRTYPESLKHDQSKGPFNFHAVEARESTPLPSFYPFGTILNLCPYQGFIELFCLNFRKIAEILKI